MSRSSGLGYLVVGLISLVSLAIRLNIVAAAGVPLNDGGLFYNFISDLLENGLRLPALSTYNSASIPLAYPPLAFYATAGFHLITRISVLKILQYGPALLSVASIPAFYLLALEILDSEEAAAIATIVFSFLPRSFDWLIMGGGLTRSAGLVFGLLTVRELHRLFRGNARGAMVGTVLWGTLLVLSHPEASVHTAITAVLLYLWYDRSLRGLRDAVIVAASITVLSAAWWGVVVAHHGLDPFLAAATAARQDSYDPLVGLLALFRFQFTDEPFLQVLGVMGLLGLILQVARRDFLLPMWLVLMHLVEPRGATLFMMIPLAMSAGFFLQEIFLPAVGERPFLNDHSAPGLRGPYLGLRSASILSFLGLYGCMSAYALGIQIRRESTLTPPDLSAFTWVRENTPPESRFALVTGELPLRDPASEWFPALTQRRSLATLFGLEWVRGVDFETKIRQYESLQKCYDEDPTCLEAWERRSGERIDLVYLRVTPEHRKSVLSVFLEQSTTYELVFSNEAALIYAVR